MSTLRASGAPGADSAGAAARDSVSGMLGRKGAASAAARRDDVEELGAEPSANGPVAVISRGGRGVGRIAGREGFGRSSDSLFTWGAGVLGGRRRCGITGRNWMRLALGCGVDERDAAGDSAGDAVAAAPTAELVRLGTMLMVRPGAGARVLVPVMRPRGAWPSGCSDMIEALEASVFPPLPAGAC